MNRPEAAARFNTIATEVFAPLYPVMAERILNESGLQSGHCIDLGCGSGMLGIALGKRTAFEVTFFDRSPAILAYAEQHIQESGLMERSRLVCGDVHAIEYADASIDLAISRGSFLFWENPEAAVAEIFRILRPGGHAFIGGGFGNAPIRERILSTMNARDPQWQARVRNDSVPNAMERLIRGVMALEHADITVTRDERGFMAHFKRP